MGCGSITMSLRGQFAYDILATSTVHFVGEILESFHENMLPSYMADMAVKRDPVNPDRSLLAIAGDGPGVMTFYLSF